MPAESTASPAPTPASNPAPGDEVPEGVPGSGEKVCPACGGSGRTPDGHDCMECLGTGKVNAGIGGG